MENEDRNDLYCSTYTIQLKKSGTMKLDGYGEELGGGSRIEIHTDFGGET